MTTAQEAKLAKKHRPLVAKICKKYRLHGYEPEDVIAIGMIGFVSAIRNWLPQRGVFEAYATTVIRNQILNEMAKTQAQKCCLMSTVELDEDAHASNFSIEETVLNKMEREERLHRFNSVNSQDRIRLVRLISEGYTLRDAAKKLGMSEALAKTKIKASVIRYEEVFGTRNN